MTFSWMMGVFVFALLLGQVINYQWMTVLFWQIRDIVTNASRNREQYRKSMDMALSECKKLRLPPHLIDRVRNWFIYTWEQQKTLGKCHICGILFWLHHNFTRIIRECNAIVIDTID
jgi:hypothetical protein